MAVELLRDLQIQRAKPAERDYSLNDGGGLSMLVKTNGAKWWRYRFTFAGKRKLMSFGVYCPKCGHSVTLEEARQRRREAESLLKQNIDPSSVGRASSSGNTSDLPDDAFQVVAAEWVFRSRAKWSADYADRIERYLKNAINPHVGHTRMNDLSAPELLQVLRRMEDRGVIESAHRVKRLLGQVFRFGIAIGRATRNPIADLQGALSPVVVTNFAAITEPADVGAMLRAIDGYVGSHVVRCALRLAPLVWLRPGELRNMEWTGFDRANSLWRIPAAKMKMRRDHLVPLSRQALAVLDDVAQLTANGRYVFPSARCQSGERPMSENAVLVALRALGYERNEMTGHGFRSTASTLLHELGFSSDVIERQLAHVNGEVKGKYDRAKHLPARVEMMQRWADYLDGLRQGVVVPFGKTKTSSLPVGSGR
jgi:integrase